MAQPVEEVALRQMRPDRGSVEPARRRFLGALLGFGSAALASMSSVDVRLRSRSSWAGTIVDSSQWVWLCGRVTLKAPLITVKSCNETRCTDLWGCGLDFA
ncbi:hypothetical protein GCM10010254_25030 [Streptomyces chromofuscus]|nr:hypothetical protein GCM10010254_25030 [Streptomyces chromofuscus]